MLWASRWALVHWQQHPRRGLWRSGIVWRLELPYEVGEEVLQSIAVLVELQELCSCSAVGDTVFSPPFSSVPERALRFSSLESFIKRASWSLIFFVHLTMYFNDTNSGVWAKVNQKKCQLLFKKQWIKLDALWLKYLWKNGTIHHEVIWSSWCY